MAGQLPLEDTDPQPKQVQVYSPSHPILPTCASREWLTGHLWTAPAATAMAGRIWSTSVSPRRCPSLGTGTDPIV